MSFNPLVSGHLHSPVRIQIARSERSCFNPLVSGHLHSPEGAQRKTKKINCFNPLVSGHLHSPISILFIISCQKFQSPRVGASSFTTGLSAFGKLQGVSIPSCRGIFIHPPIEFSELRERRVSIPSCRGIFIHLMLAYIEKSPELMFQSTRVGASSFTQSHCSNERGHHRFNPLVSGHLHSPENPIMTHIS